MNTEQNVGWFNHYLDKRMHALFAHMGTNPCTAGHYDELVLRHIWKPYW